MTKGKIPEKIKFFELFTSFIYSFITWISVVVLIVGFIGVIYYYSFFIVHRDFTNPAFFQASIYLVIGTFLVLFVYDERCRKRLRSKSKNLKT